MDRCYAHSTWRHKAKFICAKRSSLIHYSLTLILGEILLDKDWIFFFPHINAKTSTLRILFIFQWSAKLQVSDRGWVLKYQLECDFKHVVGMRYFFWGGGGAGGQITVQRYFVFVSTVGLRNLYFRELPYMMKSCEYIFKKIGPKHAHFQYYARKLLWLKSLLLWVILGEN